MEICQYKFDIQNALTKFHRYVCRISMVSKHIPMRLVNHAHRILERCEYREP